MKKISFHLLCLSFILTGCLYPQNNQSENQAPNEAQIEMIQTAVDQYYEKTDGYIPVQTKPSETPIFEKYIIDFDLLKKENLIQELPKNSFEEGGYYKYALINPEDDPTVKLIDVRIANQLQSIFVKLNLYRDKYAYPPFAEHIEEGYYTIDYEKLGYQSEPYVTSPYSGQKLPVIIDEQGKLYVDYRPDLHREIKENGEGSYEDIRFILVDHSPFLPIYSPKYEIKDGLPVLYNDE